MTDKKKDPKEVLQYLKNKVAVERQKADDCLRKAEGHKAAAMAYSDAADAAEVLVAGDPES